MGAQGGVMVSMPDPLEPPVITIEGHSLARPARWGADRCRGGRLAHVRLWQEPLR